MQNIMKQNLNLIACKQGSIILACFGETVDFI